MRILSYSSVFWPSVGGIQNCLRLLAQEFARQGHEVVVATETPADGPDRFPFRVVRRASLKEFCSLLGWADLLHHNNLTLKQLHPLAFVPRPLVVSHHGEYIRHRGHRGVRDMLKLGVSRFAVNLACSEFIGRQFPRCAVVLNPYDSSIFHDLGGERDRDLVFVGRLVSQKGCDTLIEALAELAREGLRPSLTIVGDGPDRPMLEAMASEHGLARQIDFAGSMAPDCVAAILNRHRILVVPSRYREPFGIVALEGLACGCFPIVSRQGGLVEAIGLHGETFENGDAADLARVLAETLSAWPAALARLNGVEAYLAARTPEAVAAAYVEVFHSALSR